MTERFEDSIFAVVAEQGEYSDYTTWIAAAYFSRDKAERLAAKLRHDRKTQDRAWQEWQLRREEAVPAPPTSATSQEIIAYFDLRKTWDSHNPPPSIAEYGVEYSVLPIIIGKPGRYWPKP